MLKNEIYIKLQMCYNKNTNGKSKIWGTSKNYKGDSSVISLRLSNDLISKFDEIANETGRTRNEILSMALEYALSNVEIKK